MPWTGPRLPPEEWYLPHIKQALHRKNLISFSTDRSSEKTPYGVVTPL